MKKMLIVTGFVLLVSCHANENTSSETTDLLQFVDPFIGTGFHGHTFPGAVVPHGRVQLSPDTHMFGWEASSGYHYDDTTLYGFSHTHLSGTGIGDLGDILFLPFTGNVADEKPVGKLDHTTEDASPGYYKVTVAPWDVKAELTTTKRTGWHRYNYPENEETNLMVDLSHVLQADWGHRVIEGEMNIVDEYTIEGYRLTSGWAAYDPIYFKCVFNKPLKSHEFWVDGEKLEENLVKGKDVIAYFSFENDGEALESKVALSSVDAKGAANNMNELDEKKSFDDVVNAAQSEWEKELLAIDIQTTDKDILTNFYTALYHTKIAPMIFSDLDGRYMGIDQKVHENDGEEHFTIYSLWDTFRSWYPLMTVVEPERAGKWALDLYQHYQEGGLLPKWPLNGNYTGTMVGYPATSILADAYQKKIVTNNSNEILESAVTSSTWQEDFNKKHRGMRAERVMPMHIYYKEELGFVPVDKCRESVSYGLEMAYYDWCVAQIASISGDQQTASAYYEKGKAYQQYYDPESKFMRGKNSDGSWDPDFNPRYSNHEKSEFVEGNSYQWTPFIPHDPIGFTELLGGEEALGVWLDSLFMTSSDMIGENVSSDITGLIGQYAHGNEPSHHVPFLYKYSDRPWRAEEVIDTILYHFYTPTPEGIIGNEDCGQMSAWYVLNAIGIYQLAPGNTEFMIGRPIVDGAKIKTKNGWFEISVINNSKQNKYVKEVKLNGKSIKNQRFDYADIKAGSKLQIFMKNKP